MSISQILETVIPRTAELEEKHRYYKTKWKTQPKNTLELNYSRTCYTKMIEVRKLLLINDEILQMLGAK